MVMKETGYQETSPNIEGHLLKIIIHILVLKLIVLILLIQMTQSF
jgi:hypothetical protein